MQIEKVYEATSELKKPLDRVFTTIRQHYHPKMLHELFTDTVDIGKGQIAKLTATKNGGKLNSMSTFSLLQNGAETLRAIFHNNGKQIKFSIVPPDINMSQAYKDVRNALLAMGEKGKISNTSDRSRQFVV